MLKIKQKPHHRVIHNSKRLSPILRITRNVFVATFMLGGLLVGAAAAFTWYNGAYGEQPKVTATIRKPVKSKAPVQHSPTARVGASIQMLSSPVSPGENATMTVRTNTMANCTIKVEYNNKPAVDSGLVPKKSDEYGMVTWGWTVPAGTPLGKWPVTVLCANQKNSGQVIGDLVIVKKAAVQ